MSEVTRAVASGAHRTDERASSNADPHGEFHIPMTTYVAVIIALMVLLIVTVIAAFLPLGFLNMPVAMAIATVKAALVILYFMHVKFASRLTKVFVAGSFLWLTILFVMAFGDYWSRGWSPNSRGWDANPVKATYDGYAEAYHRREGHGDAHGQSGPPGGDRHGQPQGAPGATTTTSEDAAHGRPGAG